MEREKKKEKNLKLHYADFGGDSDSVTICVTFGKNHRIALELQHSSVLHYLSVCIQPIESRLPGPHVILSVESRYDSSHSASTIAANTRSRTFRLSACFIVYVIGCYGK